MYIDYKVTIWKRIHFNENTDPKKVIQALEEGGLDDVFDEELGFVEQEFLYETEEKMIPEENDGCSTIKVYEDSKIIYKNGGD